MKMRGMVHAGWRHSPREVEGCSPLQGVLSVCAGLDQAAGLSQKRVDPDQESGKRSCAGNGDPEAAI